MGSRSIIVAIVENKKIYGWKSFTIYLYWRLAFSGRLFSSAGNENAFCAVIWPFSFWIQICPPELGAIAFVVIVLQ